MKVAHIKNAINEVITKKIKMDEESHFEGYSFVTYGSDVNIVDIDHPLITVNKDSLVIKWNGKLDLHNNGVHGLTIDIKSITAKTDEKSNSEVQSGPLNLNGFEFVVIKIKNPEAEDVQAFINAVHILTKEEKINVEFIV